MEASEAGEGEAGGGGGGVFRVRVSLQRYFGDERAWCYMSARGARPVRSLARRLRRAFRLPRPFALLAAGHLLPPDEPLALLRPDEPVHVIPTKWSELAVSDSNGAGDHQAIVPSRFPDFGRPPSPGQSAGDKPDAAVAVPHAGETEEPKRPLEEYEPAGDKPDASETEDPKRPLEEYEPAGDEPDASETEEPKRPLEEYEPAGDEPDAAPRAGELEEWKRRALRLLEKREAPPAGDEPEEGPRRALRHFDEDEAPPARRRRRVRRRRRPGAPRPPAGVGERATPDEQLSMERDSATEHERAAEEAPRPAPAAAVVRNGAAGPRAPRLVRPLPAPAPALALAPECCGDAAVATSA